MTYNIHAWRDASHLDNLDRLIKLINDVQPDVLCLNEVLHPFVGPPTDHPYWTAVRERRGYGTVPPDGSFPAEEDPEAYLNRLVHATGLSHFTFAAANEMGSFFGKYPFGNAILSRYPLTSKSSVILQVTPEDLTLGGQKRTPSDLEPRAAVAATIMLPNTAIGVCSVHLDHKAEELRERQIAEAIQFCQRVLEGHAHIICGDLNTFQRSDLSERQWEGVCAHYAKMGWPPAPEKSLVLQCLAANGYCDAHHTLKATKRADAELTEIYPPLTCWSQKPLFRLDYLFLSSDSAVTSNGAGQSPIRVVSHRTIESTVSDHYPVVIELEF